MKWRGWFRLIHRDLGYLCVALTLAYGLSGIAVNHIEDWNPNYRFERWAIDVGALPTGSPQESANALVERLRIAAPTVRGHFQDSPTRLRLYLDQGQEVDVDLRTGRGQYQGLSRRPVFFEVNALHLNNLKGAWTYIADAFAVALMAMAITGASMMKGAAGFRGRGKWFVLAGLAVPVVAVIYVTRG